jgi:3-oxoacyl-[acyl-carrier-protein] synthase II
VTAHQPDIFVTGMGIVSAAGWSAEETWQAAVSGKSCITKLERFPVFPGSTQVAGTVPGYETKAPSSSAATEYATAAVREAMDQAGLTPDDAIDAVIAGNHGERALPVNGDEAKLLGVADLAPTLARTTGAKAATSVYGACASGSIAIGTGMQLIRSGAARRVVAGGADCLLREYDFFHFCALYAMTTRDCAPEEACCPFDKRRDGFVLSEGAGFVVLEHEDAVRERGAEPLAVMEGFGSRQNAYHIVASPPDALGPTQAMERALKDAQVPAEAITYISAHGTSTRDNDWCETLAVRQALGGHADNIMMSSVKSALGHTMGAAGAIELVLSVKALQTGMVPPTINLEEPDANCDLDYVPFEARSVELSHVLTNSFGFGGHSTALVVGAVR